MTMTTMHARRTSRDNVLLLRPVCTVRTNPFGAYTPVVHPRGGEAPAPALTGTPAFATPDEAAAYARTRLGLAVIGVDGDNHPDDAA